MLYTWGRGDRGQLGLGARDDRLVPVPVAGTLSGRRVSRAACGHHHTACVSVGGAVFTFGSCHGEAQTTSTEVVSVGAGSTDMDDEELEQDVLSAVQVRGVLAQINAHDVACCAAHTAVRTAQAIVFAQTSPRKHPDHPPTPTTVTTPPASLATIPEAPHTPAPPPSSTTKTSTESSGGGGGVNLLQSLWQSVTAPLSLPPSPTAPPAPTSRPIVLGLGVNLHNCTEVRSPKHVYDGALAH